jgi:hypothetical protein
MELNPAKRGGPAHARLKLLGLMPRDSLDILIGRERRPWAMTRHEAELWLIEHWSVVVETMVSERIETLLAKARATS